MKILLDTHAFLFWRTDALAGRARELIADPDNEIYLSAASVWEISIKRGIGRLSMQGNVEDMAAEDGFLPLAINLDHARLAGELPMHHRDPFDRLIVAQALCEGLVIATRDAALAQYDAPLISV